MADDAIALRCGLPPDAIAAYEATFYAVRDRLDHMDHLLFGAFGARPYDGDVGGDPEVALRLLAYFGGPLMADALLALPGGEATPAGVTPTADPHLADLFRLAVAAQAVRVDARTAPVLIRLNDRVAAIGRAEAADSAAAVTQAVVSMPFDVAILAVTAPPVRAEAPIGAVSATSLRAECARDGRDRAESAPGTTRTPGPDRSDFGLRATG